MKETQKHSLYLCYFGLLEPLVQTQVVPYLKQLASGGIKISLLTFEPNLKERWDKEKIETERKKLTEMGITWYCLPYHKTPTVPATTYDVLRGALFAIWLSRKEKVDIFHARVHIPAAMGAIAKFFCGGKLLFDIRGFLPEEYTDGGLWKENGLLYKSVKVVERILLKYSDGFVVLTEQARQILFPESSETGFDKHGRPVEVIPCCIDKKRFQVFDPLNRDEIRKEMNLEGKRVFIYCGSFGGWYLTDEMLTFLVHANRQNPDNFALILTPRDVETIRNKLIAFGMEEKDFLIKTVLPAEVPRYLKASDVAILFIKACYSKLSSSPTKIGEYLAGGLPIISNSGVGDLDLMITGDNVGVIFNNFSEKDYSKALDDFNKIMENKELQNHCREVAYKYYDIESVGRIRYRRLYERLFNNNKLKKK